MISTVPKARRSIVNDLTVTPDTWAHYPSIERSNIKSCVFTSLSSSTYIRHSQLKGVQIFSEHGKSSYIEHCDLGSCSISDSHVERCCLRATSVSDDSHLEHSSASRTKFLGAGHVEHSNFQESKVRNRAAVIRSEIKQCDLAGDSHVENSILNQVTLKNSMVEGVILVDCDIKDCQISRTRLSGMMLRYGIWNDGRLVGSTSSQHEAVAMPIAEWRVRQEQDAKAWRQDEQCIAAGLLAASASIAPSRDQHLRATHTLHNLPRRECAPPSYASLQAQEAPNTFERGLTPPSPSSDGFSDTTELLDSNAEEVHPQSPEKERPPPPYWP
ncbi:hypothetical protein LOZ57_005868 [Ophidiomyces ophidiicola]|uniref:uncharacterized protein n=1 Tax=Ophidiomyces ophidiicola TaxID=1387563 RepID=UPI0020C3858F|nr:uncharacterized protein LOZ57_005868 [Ophidiomyces ophidiicola]KAI1940725.1 hypothetical protein LOZ57_005868 [Ophidiomyces ophidiicola]KAI2047778.1 hypothetical protein LOZ43_005561 [Ophidiomyces ophidiicola]